MRRLSPRRFSSAAERPLRDWQRARDDVRLRFSCTRCGKCCTGRGGRVRVNERELRAIAAATRESLDGVKQKFVRPSDDQRDAWLLRQSEDDTHCVFLDGTRCSIYQARPTQCRTYPWWPQHLISDYDWRVAAKECEGISTDTTVDGDGAGEYGSYSFDDIAPQIIAHDIHRSGENYTHAEMMELLEELLAGDEAFVQEFKEEFFAKFSRHVVFQDEEIAVLDTVLGGEEANPTRCFVFKDRLQLIQSEVELDRQSYKPERTHLTLEVHRALCIPFLWLPTTLENCCIAVLGAGASTLPLFLLHHLPHIERIDAVEPNQRVVDIGNEFFGVTEFQKQHPTRLRLHQQFGEDFINNQLRVGAKYDVIIVDVDSGEIHNGIAAPPPSMLTDQFLESLKRVLKPGGGIAAFNVIAESTDVLARVRARLETVFPHGAVLQLKNTRNTVFYLFSSDEDEISARAVENLVERLKHDHFQATNAQTAELVASGSEIVGLW